MQGNPCKSEFIEKSKSKQKLTLQGAFLFTEQGFPCIGYNSFVVQLQGFPSFSNSFYLFWLHFFPVLLTFFPCSIYRVFPVFQKFGFTGNSLYWLQFFFVSITGLSLL
jgi:hypothetical protein